MNSVTTKILSFLLAICVATCLLTITVQMVNQKYKTETAIIATADNSIVFKGVFIRDEEVVRYGGEGTVSYCVPDGGKLGAGSKIAEIYADEGQIDIKENLKNVNNELTVLEKIQNPGTLRSAQPASISNLINEKYRAIINIRESENLDNLSTRKNELLVLMSTYQMLTGVDADLSKQINVINSEKIKLEASETLPLDSLVAAHSAYFVSYADGYEDKLKASDLSSISPELINDVKDSGTINDKTVIGKLINSYEWYLAGMIGDSNSFAVNDNVSIKFQSTSDIAEGIICDIRETGNDGEKMIIIRCDEITFDLVQHRTERVEIIAGEYGELKGIKVPRKAIHFQKNKESVYDEKTGTETIKDVEYKGVYVKLGERISFKKIDVIYEDDDYVLSSLTAGSSYLALYDDIVVKGVDDNGN